MPLTSRDILKLDSFWAYRVVALADTISRYTLSVAKEVGGLNLSQWRVLAAVAEKSGRSAAEVVAVTPMDKTIVSRAVASLIDDGLISKTPDAHDKRRAALSITPQGEVIYRKIAKRLKADVMDLSHEDVQGEDLAQTLKGFAAQMPKASRT